MTALRDLFMLDPEVYFLNHGSFGATPRPVMAAYQEWQNRLERQPVQFITAELPEHLAAARQALGSYIQADPADVVFVPNATYGVNVVARSLHLGPGDEVLGTDHEYGACENTWLFMARQRGFTYRRQPIPLPVVSAAEIVETFWQGVTPQTKVIFMSHITSPTAVHFPIADICARARAAGILTMIDGAHAVGQIPLDMAALGADFYTSNAHKWLCSPKGSAFLYTRRERQPLIEPLVVGWGWGDGRTLTFGSDYIDYLQWLGTDDVAAYLSVPAAIAFQAAHQWDRVRAACHALVGETMARIGALTGLPPIYGHAGLYGQMATIPLPLGTDTAVLKHGLYHEHHIEIPCLMWGERPFIRVSVQGYNTPTDLDALVAALSTLMARGL